MEIAPHLTWKACLCWARVCRRFAESWPRSRRELSGHIHLLNIVGAALPRFCNLRALEVINNTTITDASLAPLTRLTQMIIGGMDLSLTDAALRPLKQLRRLALLNTGSTITDESLASLTNLNSLLLAGIHGITDAGLRPLANSLTQLSLLGDWVRVITDLGLRALTNLRRLCLDNNTTVQGSGSFAHLTRLEELWLAGSSILDVSALSKLPRLAVLRLNESEAIADDTALGHLTSLTALHLYDQTSLTCAAFRSLPRLRHLMVVGQTGLTAAGLADFPHVRVDGKILRRSNQRR